MSCFSVFSPRPKKAKKTFPTVLLTCLSLAVPPPVIPRGVLQLDETRDRVQGSAQRLATSDDGCTVDGRVFSHEFGFAPEKSRLPFAGA